MSDREEFAGTTGLSTDALQFSDFVKNGVWDVDDVLKPIYEQASEKMGREFPYPTKSEKK